MIQQVNCYPKQMVSFAAHALTLSPATLVLLQPRNFRSILLPEFYKLTSLTRVKSEITVLPLPQRSTTLALQYQGSKVSNSLFHLALLPQ